MKTRFHVITKLALAEWYETKGAMWIRNARKYRADRPGEQMRDYARNRHDVAMRNALRYQITAKAIRMLNADQEADLLEFQVGGPDGIGDESYDNPITVVRPSPSLQPRRRYFRFVDIGD